MVYEGLRLEEMLGTGQIHFTGSAMYLKNLWKLPRKINQEDRNKITELDKLKLEYIRQLSVK